tara:strand:- start:8 stop:307 length:300 start_codon:yes stop_codon:yes gene_type:complete
VLLSKFTIEYKISFGLSLSINDEFKVKNPATDNVESKKIDRKLIFTFIVNKTKNNSPNVKPDLDCNKNDNIEKIKKHKILWDDLVNKNSEDIINPKKRK